jgi:plasmid replication initiation protein
MALSDNTETKLNLIKKHVNAIHCTNNLSLVQRKIFNAFLFNAYHDLPHKSQFEISIRKLSELIGYDSRDYKKLKKSLIDLISTVIEWSIIDHSEQIVDEKWRASAIISAAKIEKGVCTYEFSNIMREILYRPEMYGKIDIKVMIEFQSGYALALYENCIRFQGVSQTPWFSINTFRKLMGVADHSYKNFCDLKKRVLDIAVKEVNLYCPIHVTPEINRVNRKVLGIRFKINNKNRAQNSDGNLLNMLKTEFSISEDGLKKLLDQYEISYIQQKVDIIKQSDSFKSKKIRGLAAYLIDALRRDYKPTKTNKKHSSMEEEEKQKTLKNLEFVKRREESLNKRKIVDDYLASLDEDEMNSLLFTFEEYLQDKDSFYLYKKFRKTGIKTPPVRAVFNIYILSLLEKI